jgi:hypothetical protein
MTAQLRRQRVVLDVVFEDTKHRASPAEWDWAALLDVAGHESVAVIGRSEIAATSNPPAHHYTLGEANALLKDPGKAVNDYTMNADTVFIRLLKNNGVVYLVDGDDGVIIEISRPGDELDGAVAVLQVPKCDLLDDEVR